MFYKCSNFLNDMRTRCHKGQVIPIRWNISSGNIMFNKCSNSSNDLLIFKPDTLTVLFLPVGMLNAEYMPNWFLVNRKRGRKNVIKKQSPCCIQLKNNNYTLLKSSINIFPVFQIHRYIRAGSVSTTSRNDRI